MIYLYNALHVLCIVSFLINPSGEADQTCAPAGWTPKSIISVHHLIYNQ